MTNANQLTVTTEIPFADRVKIHANRFFLAPGVYDGLGALLTAQHDEKVADHRGLLLIVKLDDFLLRQLIKCHFYHADGSLYDLLPRRNDGTGLLTL